MKNLISCLLIITISFGCQPKKDSAHKKDISPNLILILADDLGYGDVGFNGCKDIPTPNIDRIAMNGVVCTQAYVTFPVCGPSRAGIISGRYQGRFGFSKNPLFTPKDSLQGLPLSEVTIASALKQANYKTAALGKWHLGAHPSQWPINRGFDEFFGFLTGGHHYFPDKWDLADEKAVKSQYEAYRTKLLHNTERIDEKEYLTDALSREAVNYIDTFKDDPFFIYLAYNAPHTPLQATEKYLSRFEHIDDIQRKTYAAMVSSIDDGVGQILDRLDSLNLTENTIIVFLSDNGGPEPTNGSDNGPLRGIKGSLWEGGIRVPFAMQWPTHIPSHVTYDKPVSSLDIYATIADLNKSSIELPHTLDGVNLVPYFNGQKTTLPHDYLFWRHYMKNQHAVVAGDEKIIISPEEGNNFFNLRDDIGEQSNAVSEHKNEFDRLENRFEDWQRLLIEPVFLGLSENDKYDELHPDRFDYDEDN